MKQGKRIFLGQPAGNMKGFVGLAQRECPLWSKACRNAYQFLLKICESPLLIMEGLTIDAERINSLHVKRQLPLLILGGMTIDTERINSLCVWKGNNLCMWKGDCLCTWKSDHLCVWKGNCLCCSWVGADQQLMQRINSQLSHGKFKIFTLFSPACWY